jgi:hypothetical protein
MKKKPEQCIVCRREKMCEGEGGYTLREAERDFMHRERELPEQVWVCCWNCYEQYRHSLAICKNTRWKRKELLTDEDKYYGFRLYRKKPIVIKAKQMKESFECKTLEGTLKGNATDYLVVGIKGENYPVRKDIYPVRKDIFDETYEEVK